MLSAVSQHVQLAEVTGTEGMADVGRKKVCTRSTDHTDGTKKRQTVDNDPRTNQRKNAFLCLFKTVKMASCSSGPHERAVLHHRADEALVRYGAAV